MASDKTPLLESNREKSVDVSSAPLPTPPATSQSNISINLKAKANKALEMTILTAAMECNPWQHAPSSRRVRYDEVSKTLLQKGINATHHQIQVVVDRKLIQYYKYRSDPDNNSSYLANKPREFLDVMTKIASYLSQLDMRRKKIKSDGINNPQREESHKNDNFIDLSDSTAPSSPVIVEPTVPSRRRRSVHMEYKPQSGSEFMVSSQSHPPAPHQPIPLPPLYSHSQAPQEHFSSHKPNPFHDQPNPFASSTSHWPSGYSGSNGQPPQASTHHPIQPKPLSHKSTPHPPSSLSNPPSVPSMPSRSQTNHNCCSHDCHKIQSKLFTPLKEFLEKKLEWDHAKLERENWRYEKQLEIENQQRARQIEIDREIRLREIEQRAMEVQLDRQVMDKFFKMMNEFMDQFNQNHEHSPRSQAIPPPQPMMAPPVGSRSVVVPGPNAPLPNPHTQPPHQPLLHTNKIKLTGHKPAPISVPPPPTHPSQLPHPHPSSHSHSSHSHHQSR